MRGKEIKVLMFGGSGFVATGVQVALVDRNIKFITPPSKEVDILNKRSIEDCVNEHKPDAIWNFAADTNVDGAQKNPEIAKAINLDGAINIAEVSTESRIPLSHMSTDFRYPGNLKNKGPYKDNAKTADPDSREIGEYARYKLMADNEVLSIHPNPAIVVINSPMWNLGYKKDYLAKIKNLILRNLSIAQDQHLTLTYVPDLAYGLEMITRKSMSGIFHITTYPVVTPYQVACYLAPKLNLVNEVIPGSIYDFLGKEGVAPRSIWGGLISSKGFKSTYVWDAIDQVVGQRSF